ncbi:LytR/AlgR family response regulator transcription factor [Caldisalinibacter kiritimatiensis]|uniref:Two-component response regulator n=1 Tax=Caldisalinibacter kiritimatiensis TaxID=1304284 RepID=R1CLL5_9FIRM|nr:LytTR family DNA-binding domain-containing protein [Caldisalinibacter kiritimatiensis]EOC99585.1 Two-component response regulator [Caldisalinibacter kiritimatiensis]
MNRLAYKNRSEVGFIDFDKIIFIEKLQNKTIIHTKNNEIEIHSSLNSVYDKLDKEIFIRTHRSYIVNINHIKKIIPWGQKTYRIIFKGIDEDALFSYERYKDFKDKVCQF